jgi:dTDP-glucose 4,6-dehydratase
MKLLVTGGCGFIGSNLVRYMLSKYDNVQIVNVDNLSYGSNLANLKDIEKNPRYRFIKGSIANKNLVNEVTKNVDAVVNIAAETHVDRSISNPQSFFRSNTFGTFNLLETARKTNIKTFLHVSTDEIYGAAQGNSSFKESDMLLPSNPYSASKASAEMFAVAYHKTYGLKTIVTRCTNNFGPNQSPEKFIPKVVIRTLLGQKVPVYGSGKQVRDWTFVIDHCEALDLVLRKGNSGEIYNISTGNEIENVKVVEMILDIFRKSKDMIEFVEDRPGHDIRYSVDSTKIRSELGWKPKHSFKEAIAKTVDWYVSNESWWKPIVDERILHPTPWKLKW